MTGDTERMLRADLHVHSYHSGHAAHLRVSARARLLLGARGGLRRRRRPAAWTSVTITDHDSIDGCLEFLERHPDAPTTSSSAKRSNAAFPTSDLKVHIWAPTASPSGSTAKSSRSGATFSRRSRTSAVRRGLLRPESSVLLLQGAAAARTTISASRAGCFRRSRCATARCSRAHNELAEAIVREWRRRARPPLTAIGGSDAHTLAGIGTTYTEAPGTTRDDFLQSLRAGRARAGGRHGSTWREAREIYGVVARYWATLLGAGRQDLSWRRRRVGTRIFRPLDAVRILAARRRGAPQARRSAARWPAIGATGRFGARLGRGPGDRLRGASARTGRGAGAATMSRRRVVVTGIGLMSALGTHARGGVGRPRRAAGAASRTSRCSTPPATAAEGRRDPAPTRRDPAFSEKAWRRLSRSDQIAVIASREALADAGLLDANVPRDRMGVILGSGTADLMRNEDWFADMRRRGVRRAPPSKIFDHFPNTPCDVVASCFGFEGLKSSVLSACSSGTVAIGLRGRRDRLGAARRRARRRERRALPADVQRLQRAPAGRQGAVPAVLPEPPGHEHRRSRGDARARGPDAGAAARRQHLRGGRRATACAARRTIRPRRNRKGRRWRR